MIEASQRAQLLDVPNHTHSKPCTARLLLLQHLGLSSSWPEKKTAVLWPKNINKTNGNFYRKKKSSPKKKQPTTLTKGKPYQHSTRLTPCPTSQQGRRSRHKSHILLQCILAQWHEYAHRNWQRENEETYNQTQAYALGKDPLTISLLNLLAACNS